METTNDPFTAIAKGAIFGLLIFFAWILLEALVFKKDTKSTCGCSKGRKNYPAEFSFQNKRITEKDVTPKQKACIALGICTDINTLGVELIPEAKIGWQKKVMESADKIFVENQPAGKSKSKPVRKKNKNK